MRFNLHFFVCVTLVLAFSTCKDNGNPIDGEKPDGEKPPCPPIDIVPPSPYDSPIWHPSGQFIGFNHTPLKEIRYPYRDTCFGEYVFQSDSAGFWLINADGTNKRRIFPYKLQNPAWSPDGQWIAFVGGAQIFKMRFSGTTFDTTTVVQLTTEGRNFFPAWSSDGLWIAYDNTVCGNAFEPPPPNSCGSLIMRKDGTDRRFVARGRMPAWAVDGSYLVYVGLLSEIYRINLSDTSQVVRLTSFNQVDPYGRDNRNPRFSPDGTKIAFWSNTSIWWMDTTGTNIQQLTTQGVTTSFGGIPFSWSPTGDEIVYTRWKATDWTMKNGVLWVVDVRSGMEVQLTANP